MPNKSRATLLLSACLLYCTTASAYAEFWDAIGYTALQSELGASMPTGVGVRVTQVEGSDSDITPSYLPDPSFVQFSGKTITDVSGVNTGGYSDHATGVGQLFYGSYTSMTPSISVIDAYLVNSWVDTDYLLMQSSSYPMSSSSRVANHSWAGSADDTAGNSDILRRVDYVVARDEFIQVVGTSNGLGTNPPLLSSAYNTISVGLTSGNNGTSTPAIDSTYTAGRTSPDLVVPLFPYTSQATPVVASAAALLVGVGHANPTLSADPVTNSTTNRNGDVIYNAERSEVIKAALMAGADRQTNNATGENITDYRAPTANQTSNGLDSRFGAGQVNIYNSYHVIAAGEQNSTEDGGAAAANIAANGFDYDPHFGGANGSNSTATYNFSTAPGENTAFSASLVWNIDIPGGSGTSFDGTATLYDFNLKLFDVTGTPFLLADSSSTGENTENIWISLQKGRSYMLQVVPGATQTSFDWDYALAWHTSEVPVPAALPLLMSGLAGFFWVGRRRATR